MKIRIELDTLESMTATVYFDDSKVEGIYDLLLYLKPSSPPLIVINIPRALGEMLEKGYIEYLKERIAEEL